VRIGEVSRAEDGSGRDNVELLPLLLQVENGLAELELQPAVHQGDRAVGLDGEGAAVGEEHGHAGFRSGRDLVSHLKFGRLPGRQLLLAGSRTLLVLQGRGTADERGEDSLIFRSCIQRSLSVVDIPRSVPEHRVDDDDIDDEIAALGGEADGVGG
jgi:hypothetical protein